MIHGYIHPAISFVAFNNLYTICASEDRLCGLVVKVPGCRSRGPGSIHGATIFSEK
jgi:hypothetical protein